MKLQNLLGNDKLKVAFGALDSTKLPHAILIEGFRGSGRKVLANDIAAAAVCENKDSQPCMVCSQCKKAQNGVHPDISFTDASDGKCSVDTIREIKRDAFVIPGEAENKVYIINGADKLSAACQNALLKLLEEPPENVILILLCENSSMLLQTIRSRTTKFVISPLSNNDVLKLLRKNHPEADSNTLVKCAELSGGIYGAAEDILMSDRSEADDNLSDFCRIICESSELAVFEGLKCLEDLSGDEMNALFADMRILIRNAIFKLNGIDDIRPPFIANQITLLSEKKSLNQLCALSDLLADAQQRCGFHASSTAIIGTLAAEIADINANC